MGQPLEKLNKTEAYEKRISFLLLCSSAQADPGNALQIAGTTIKYIPLTDND